MGPRPHLAHGPGVGASAERRPYRLLLEGLRGRIPDSKLGTTKLVFAETAITVEVNGELPKRVAYGDRAVRRDRLLRFRMTPGSFSNVMLRRLVVRQVDDRPPDRPLERLPSVWRHERFQLGNQNWYVIAYRVPHEVELDIEVDMNEAVAHAHDSRPRIVG